MSDLDFSPVPDNLDRAPASDDVHGITQSDDGGAKVEDGTEAPNAAVTANDHDAASEQTVCDNGVAPNQPEVQDAPMFHDNHDVPCEQTAGDGGLVPIEAGSRDVPQFTVDGRNMRFGTVHGAEIAVRISKIEKKGKADLDASVKPHSFIYDQVLCKTKTDKGANVTVVLPMTIGYTSKDGDDVLHKKEAPPRPIRMLHFASTSPSFFHPFYLQAIAIAFECGQSKPRFYCIGDEGDPQGSYVNCNKCFAIDTRRIPEHKDIFMQVCHIHSQALNRACQSTYINSILPSHPHRWSVLER
jgi:hypothetical protein